MARKKNKNTVVSRSFSERDYIKTKARQLPLGKCYAFGNWKYQKFTPVVVTRCHKQGTFTIGLYIVDMFCRGVQDSEYFFTKVSHLSFQLQFEMFKVV